MPKKEIINIIRQFYFSKIDPRLRYIVAKDFSTENDFKTNPVFGRRHSKLMLGVHAAN